MPCRLLIFCLGLFVCLTVSGRAQPNVTTYDAMTRQLQADTSRCPLLRLTSLGKAAGGHKSLWLVRVADPALTPAQTIRVLVLCRQHGDEPASTEGVLSLLHRLAGGGDPQLRQSLFHVTLYLVPMVNPDGADVNARSNAAGADLNRDWGIFHQPETRAVARLVPLLHPNIVLDAHNWDGSDEYNADCLEIPREAETAQGKTGHALQQEAVRQLAVCGYALHPTAWGADSDPHLAHRWFSQQNILSALIETHSGDPSDVADFQRRQGMYVALIHNLVRHYAADYAVEKPRLEAWEGNYSGDVREAALFPQPALEPPISAPRPPLSRLWLWALGAYGLALWGGRTHPSRLGSPPSRNGRGKRLRAKNVAGGRPSSPTLLLARPHRGFYWGEGGEPKRDGWIPTSRVSSGYYSLARKRLGTETRVRSGQRKAVSIPPR